MSTTPPLRLEGATLVAQWAAGRGASGGNAFPILETGFFGVQAAFIAAWAVSRNVVVDGVAT
jgi:hypothetical protein